MKAKASLYYSLPNTSRLRSRLNNPPKELTSDLRAKVAEIIVKVLNNNNLQIRAELTDYVMNRADLEFKTPELRERVSGIMSGIFDSVFALSMDDLNALLNESKPESDDDAADSADEPDGTEEPAKAKASKAKPAKPAKTNSSKAAAEVGDGDEEF